MDKFEMIYTRPFDDDQFTLCPKCQWRTDWEYVSGGEGQERHTCLNPKCSFQFIMETDSEDESYD